MKEEDDIEAAARRVQEMKAELKAHLRCLRAM